LEAESPPITEPMGIACVRFKCRYSLEGESGLGPEGRANYKSNKL
jgi:hypothetical protein